MTRAAKGGPCALLALLLAGALAGPERAGAGSAAAAFDFGPAPRDADGRFENFTPFERAGPGVTLPFFARRIAAMLRGRSGAPERVENDGAWLRENARHSDPSVTWIGHATLLVQIGGQTFLTDPIWSQTASPVSWLGPRRTVAPGLTLDDLPPIDFVLVSHNHYDHLDLATLERLARRHAHTRFLVPLGNAELLRDRGIGNVVELDWGEAHRTGRLEVVCLPAQHWSNRWPGDARRALWSSWAVVGPERRFYFSGDTGWFAGFAAIGETYGPFDLAALAIGAYEPVAMMQPVHLNPEEAVRAALALRAHRALGIHFGTFDLADEPLDEPPRRFRDAARTEGYEGDWILRIGETRVF